jgi:hypothetical protein
MYSNNGVKGMVRAEDAGEAAEGTGYGKVWAMFREIAGRQAETDKQIRETDRIVKELSKNIGGLNNAFGKWAEELVPAKLWEKFNGIGYQFTRGGPMEFWEGGRTVAHTARK